MFPPAPTPTPAITTPLSPWFRNWKGREGDADKSIIFIAEKGMAGVWPAGLVNVLNRIYHPSSWKPQATGAKPVPSSLPCWCRKRPDQQPLQVEGPAKQMFLLSNPPIRGVAAPLLGVGQEVRSATVVAVPLLGNLRHVAQMIPPSHIHTRAIIGK